MKRRLFNLAAAVSLGMMLAVIALWVRSYRAYDVWMYASDGGERFALWTVPGRVAIRWGHGLYHEPRNGWQYDSGTQMPGLRVPFGIERTRYLQYFPNSWLLGLPFWLPCILFGVAPTCWLIGAHRWRSRRRNLGVCPICGYDLRATPDRCPECGMAVAPKPAEAAA